MDSNDQPAVVGVAHPATIAALTLGTTVGLLEVVHGGLTMTPYVSSAAAGFSSVALLAAFSGFLSFALWCLVGPPLVRYGGLEAGPLASSLAAAMGGLWYPCLTGVADLQAIMGSGWKAAAWLWGGALFGLFVYLGSSKLDSERGLGFALGRAAVLTPFALTAGFFLQWAIGRRGDWVGSTLSWTGVVALSAGLAFAYRRLRPQHYAGAAYGLAGFFLLAAALALNWPSSGPTASVSASMQAAGPPVVLITVDTLRWDETSPYRSDARTPHLQGLAEDGVVFERAYSVAPWTIPSVFSLLTGVSPWAHGALFFDDAPPPQLPTVAEYLRDAGYRTAAVVHNGLLADYANGGATVRGFSQHTTYPRVNYPTTLGFRAAAVAFRRQIELLIGPADVTDRAVEMLRRRDGRSTFLWAHYFAPHAAYEPPAEWRPEGNPVEPYADGFPSLTEIRAGMVPLTPEQRNWARELYRAEVRQTDAEIGRLIDELKAADLYDEALIIFTSDHGEEFWEHGLAYHGQSLYDELIRAPLIVKPPKTPRPRRVKQTVSTVSLAPTILDVAGVDYDETDFSDRSLREFWTSEIDPEARPAFATGLTYFEQQEAVVLDRIKLIETHGPRGDMLFDLARDPAEEINLRDRRPADLERARAALQQHREHSQRIRDRYGLGALKQEMGEDRLELLKSLGYL